MHGFLGDTGPEEIMLGSSRQQSESEGNVHENSYCVAKGMREKEEEERDKRRTT